MGTERIVLVHHTDCEMAKHTDDQIRERLPAGAEADFDLLTIADPPAELRQDLGAIRDSDLVPSSTAIHACVYDLERRVIRPL
ncbi:MAG TPA: hypothetical protein VH703_04190 [Solirubrobacterales bacterium]|jgi:carbonic anhydrase